MKKVVWTSILAGAAIACFAVGDAAAQGRPQGPRQQTRVRIERRLQQQFTRFDQNRNGAIDRAEWRRNERIFRRFDANRDGGLNLNEYRRLVRAAGARRLAGRR